MTAGSRISTQVPASRKTPERFLETQHAAPSNIKYPTDLNLVNDARELTENIIDQLAETAGQSFATSAYQATNLSQAIS